MATVTSGGAAWEDVLVALYRASCTEARADSTLWSRMNTIDELMYTSFKKMFTLWKESSKDGAQDSSKVDASGLPLDIIPPNAVVYANAMELAAYLCAVYAYKNPIIDVPTLPNAPHVTEAVKAKLQRDSNAGNWALEMIKIIQSAVFYNLSPAEVRLTSTKDNSLRAIDPQNCFYDVSVSPDRVSMDGMYAGYTEVVTLTMLYRIMSAVPNEFVSRAAQQLLTNINALEQVAMLRAETQGFVGAYRDTTVSSQLAKALGMGLIEGAQASGGGAVNWNAFYDNLDIPKDSPASQRMKISANTFELTTYYRRAMPAWLELPPKTYSSYTGSAGQLPVFRILILNHTYLLACEPVKEQHGRIPMMFGSITADSSGSVALAYTESLGATQIYTDKLNAARIEAIRRALSDRGLYDSELVDGDAIKNRGAAAQIPVNGHALKDRDKSIRDAYLHLPFDASGVSALLGMLGESQNFAERISGNNAQMQGGRLPGNKTALEAQREASFGEGRFRVYSIIFQQTFMMPFKIILRSNMGESTSVLTYYDAAAGVKKALTPQEFKDNEFDFELSDGQLPSSKLLSPEAVGQLITAVIQVPELRQTKDLGIMMDLFAGALGVEDFDRIPPPNAASQAAIAAVASQQGGAAPQQQDTGAGSAGANDATGTAVQRDKQA